MNINYTRFNKPVFLVFIFSVGCFFSFGQLNKLPLVIKDNYNSTGNLRGAVKEIVAIFSSHMSAATSQVHDTIIYKLNKAKDTATYTNIPENARYGHRGEMYCFEYHLYDKNGRLFLRQCFKGSIKEKEFAYKEEAIKPLKVEIQKGYSSTDTVRSYYNKAGLLVKQVTTKDYDPMRWIKTYKYDQYGNLIEEAMFLDYDGNGKRIVRTQCETTTYKYDSLGNWTTRKISHLSNLTPNDTSSYNTWTRTITYW